MKTVILALVSLTVGATYTLPVDNNLDQSQYKLYDAEVHAIFVYTTSPAYVSAINKGIDTISIINKTNDTIFITPFNVE